MSTVAGGAEAFSASPRLCVGPRPVLLVPGWSDTARALRHCRAFLIDNGWSAGAVRCVDFADRFGSSIEHADEIAAAASVLLKETGAEGIDVAAHSMGGLALRVLLARPDAPPVHTAIFAGTPHHGTWAALLAWGAGGREMRPGSRLLQQLNATPLPPGVRSICLRTPVDTRILPGSSAWLDGAECITVRWPLHPRLLRHPPTLRLIRDLLRSPAPASGTQPPSPLS